MTEEIKIPTEVFDRHKKAEEERNDPIVMAIATQLTEVLIRDGLLTREQVDAVSKPVDKCRMCSESLCLCKGPYDCGTGV